MRSIDYSNGETPDQEDTGDPAQPGSGDCNFDGDSRSNDRVACRCPDCRGDGVGSRGRVGPEEIEPNAVDGAAGVRLRRAGDEFLITHVELGDGAVRRIVRFDPSW